MTGSRRVWICRPRSAWSAAGGALLVALVPIVFHATAELTIPRWETVGAAFLPRVLAVLLGLGGAFMILEEFRLPPKSGTGGDSAAPAGPRTSLRAAGVTAAAFAASWAIAEIGFVVPALVFMVGSGAVLSMGRIRWMRLLAVSVFIAVGVFLLFTRVFVTNLQ